ncbi:MAG: hypothetical protein ACM32E_29155 [Gemmatimonadota bacterium]
MIKIRYASLPEGLHIQARRESGHTIIYLRPGLTSDQRREALRRARQSARMGHGPKLPAPGLARALAADRAMSTLRNAGAAVRQHPFGAGMLAALLAGAVVSYSLFVTVSVRLIYPQVPGLQPTVPHPTVPVPVPQPGASSPGPHRSGSAAPGSGVAPTPGSSAPGKTPSPGPRPPTPAPSPSSVPPSPTPSPQPSPGGVCVKVGPLGICLSL